MVVRIEVTPEELLRIANEMAAIAEDLRHAHGRLSGLTEDAIGARNIDGALEDFADHWRYGMDRMTKGVRWTAEALTTAGTTYGDVEGGLAGGIGEAVGGG